MLTARLQPEAQAMQRSWRNNPLSVRVRPDPFCHFLCDGRTRWAALGRLCLLSAPGPGNRKPVKRVWPKLCLVPKQVHSAAFHLSGGSFPEQSGGPRRSMRTQGHVSTWGPQGPSGFSSWEQGKGHKIWGHCGVLAIRWRSSLCSWGLEEGPGWGGGRSPCSGAHRPGD